MLQSEFKFLVLLKWVRKTKFVWQFHEFASNVRDFLTQFIFSRMFHYVPPESFWFNNITNAIFGNSFIYAEFWISPPWMPRLAGLMCLYLPSEPQPQLLRCLGQMARPITCNCIVATVWREQSILSPWPPRLSHNSEA